MNKKSTITRVDDLTYGLDYKLSDIQILKSLITLKIHWGAPYERTNEMWMPHLPIASTFPREDVLYGIYALDPYKYLNQQLNSQKIL